MVVKGQPKGIEPYVWKTVPYDEEILNVESYFKIYYAVSERNAPSFAMVPDGSGGHGSLPLPSISSGHGSTIKITFNVTPKENNK